MHVVHGQLDRRPAIVQKGGIALARDQIGPVDHKHQLGVQVFPEGRVLPGIGVPHGKNPVVVPKIMRASPQGRGPGQSLGAIHGHAVAKLLHLLLVDAGPVNSKRPGAVKANIRCPVKVVNITFQAVEHVRAGIIVGVAYLPRFPHGTAGNIIIELVKEHLLEPGGIRAGQNSVLPTVDGGFPTGVVGEAVKGDPARVQARLSEGTGVFPEPFCSGARLGDGDVPGHHNGDFHSLSGR